MFSGRDCGLRDLVLEGVLERSPGFGEQHHALQLALPSPLPGNRSVIGDLAEGRRMAPVASWRGTTS